MARECSSGVYESTHNSKKHWSACTCTNSVTSLSHSLPYLLREVWSRMPLVEMCPIHQHTSSPVKRERDNKV